MVCILLGAVQEGTKTEILSWRAYSRETVNESLLEKHHFVLMKKKSVCFLYGSYFR